LTLFETNRCSNLSGNGRKYKTLAVLLLLVALGGASGCTEKPSNTATTTPATGQPVTQPAGAAKPTAEQEAARQRGMAQGAAIQAANEAAQKGKPQ